MIMISQWSSLQWSVCHQMIAFCYQQFLILQWAKTNQHKYSRCKKNSCQSLTQMVDSLQSSYYSKYYYREYYYRKRRHGCGLDNLLVSIATFFAITCCWILKWKQKSLSFALQYHVYSYNCANECLYGLSGGWVGVVHMSWLLHNNSIEWCCLLLV